MAKVSAAILIYDIRGFTAASKQLPAAELGRFATAAHRSILELFAERPPTFVKNLGDGHMLIWETDEKPDPALIQFIVAAASKARAVFPAFVAGHLSDPDNAGQKLPTKVGIGVVVGEVSKSDDYYGRAVNLAARLQNESRPEGLALNQQAFDMAGSREALIKEGFKKMGLTLKGLGKNTVWVNRPFSLARLGWKALPYVIAVVVPFMYYRVADLDSPYLKWLPGGQTIRDLIDSKGWPSVRAGQDETMIQAAADADRRAIAEALLQVRRAHGMIAVELKKPDDSDVDFWSTSQNVTGLLKTPHLDLETKREIVKVLDYAFTPENFVEGYGWVPHMGEVYTEAEPTLWTVAALAGALGTKDLLEGERRTTFEGYLAKAQKAAMRFRPRETGAWNIFPNQLNLDYYSPYSTTLALLALLEVRAAGQPWEGSVEKRDALLQSTAKFLIGLFEEKEDTQGWRRTAVHADPISEGLTFQIYSELLRAEAEAGVVLPEKILSEIPRQLILLNGRTLDAAYDMGEYNVKFVSHLNKEANGREAINFLWHPWAIDTAVRWLDRATRIPAAPELVARVKRSRSYLVVDMSDKKRKEATEGYSFVAGEALIGLSAIPLPEAAKK